MIRSQARLSNGRHQLIVVHTLFQLSEFLMYRVAYLHGVRALKDGKYNG